MACLTCKEFMEFLDDYASKTQDPEVRAEFDRHIRDCPPCGEYLREYLETIRLARSCSEAREVREKAPERLIEAILAARKKNT